MIDLAPFYYAISILSGILGAFIYLSRQLTNIKTLIYQRTDAIEELFRTKLEYHEKHDDQRFSAIHSDLWQIRVADAARFGLNGRTRPVADQSKPGT